MQRSLRLVLAAVALLTLLITASPVAAATDGGADFGACVAHHATTEGGFSVNHNPGMLRGFAGWPGCPGG